jgi:hypothetical protein
LNAIAVLLIAVDIGQQKFDAALEVSHPKPERCSAALVPPSAAFRFQLGFFFVSYFAVLFNSALRIYKSRRIIV